MAKEKKSSDDANPQPNAFDDMMEFWQRGQEAFLQTQKQFTEGMETLSEELSKKSEDGSSQWFDPQTAQDAFESWQNSITAWGDDAAKAWKKSAASPFPNQFQNMFDPQVWGKVVPEELTNILETIGQGPRFADMATPHIDAANAWKETLDYGKASAAMAGVLNATWGRCYERFSKTFSLEDLQSGDNDEALESWLKIANEELLDTQRSQEFMDAQKDILRTSIQIKARQKDLAEEWASAYQMPTRTEVDDLTKTVHELRRELRKVKRELADLQGNQKA